MEAHVRDTSEKMNVSGPKKRKPLRTVSSQSSPEKDDIIEHRDKRPDEEYRLSNSREGSVNRHQETYDLADLTDTDDSDVCTNDDSDSMQEKERSVTPASRIDRQNSLNSSTRNPTVPTSLLSNLRTQRYDTDDYTDDMDPIPEKETSARSNGSRGTMRRPSLHSSAASFQMGSGQIHQTTTAWKGYVVIGIVAIVVFLLSKRIAYFQGDSSSNVKNAMKKAATNCEHFHDLEERYNTFDEMLWDELDVSVRRATGDVEAREPGTFLFLHYGPTAILDGFINSLTNITADCFGGAEPITLDGTYFKRSDIQADYGVFLAQQKEALLQRGVMVVRNFEDVPARAAQAFHTICDSQEPLVDRAVIYLTLDMLRAARVPVPSKQSAAAEAENLLNQLWKDTLDPTVLQPLITRVTESVYRVV